MSSQDRDRNDRVELEPVTCWPLVYGAAGFVTAVALLVGGVWAVNALRPRPADAPVVQDNAPGLAFAPPVAPKDEAPAPEPLREERQVVKRPTPPPRSPLAAWPKHPLKDRPGAPAKPKKKAVKEIAKETKRPAPLSSLAKRARGEAAGLAADLLKASREIDLEAKRSAGHRERPDGEARKSPVPVVKSTKEPLTAGIRTFVASRADLRGLPLAAEKDCLTGADAAKQLGALSTKVRRLQARRGDVPIRSSLGHVIHPSEDAKDSGLASYLTKAAKDHAKEPLAVGPLLQMFQAETRPLRRELVDTLAAIDGEEATAALAKLAVFDVSLEVREAAIAALKKRKVAEARPVLLAALRHVWAPAADHAAHALVELDDRAARGALKKFLEAPAPDAPFQKGEKWHQRELVRVNHLRSCFLCHAPADQEVADKRKATVTGPVPEPGEELPAIYYEGARRSGPSVRADVVYFRQDFSVMHKVEKASPWPEMQRFDYLVRERELTAKEVAKLREAEKKKPRADYPQLRAVKDAIDGLNRHERAESKK